MEYNKEEFEKYYNNYLDIKENIENVKRNNFNLLKNEKLKKTVEFYNNLNMEEQEIFISINCNTLFNCYFFNLKKINELETTLRSLVSSFYQSDAFPFSKEEYCFYIKDNNKIVDAISEDEISLSDMKMNFFIDTIKINNSYDPSLYTKDDIYIIKVLYDCYKDKENVDFIIKDKLKTAELLDNGELDSFKNHDKRHIEHLRWKLNDQIEKIYYNSKSPQRNLLLYETEVVNYEIDLLEGATVKELYQKLEDEYKKEHYIKEVFDYKIDALLTAYYHLTDDNFKKSSGYFHGEEDKYHFETRSVKINKRIQEMRKR